MEAISEFADAKAQLEQRIVDLERERDTIQSEIVSLNERLTVKQLETDARSLEGEVNALRGQKNLLAEKLASFDSPQVAGSFTN